MNWKPVALGLLVLGGLALGLGGAFYTGIGPAPGGADSGEPLTDFPTATPSPTPAESSAGEGAVGTPTSTPPPPFSFAIDAIDGCGLTCRDVTATLHNNQPEPATRVTVYTRLFAGRDNTDTADLVWEGREEVGTLDAGASHTTTRRVELSFQEAQAIEQRDGWVTIVTTVQTDQRTVTFRDSEQVA